MARHRTQLSLSEDRYHALAELAESRQSSVSEVARDLIELGLQKMQERRERGQKALAGLSSLRRELEARIGVSPGDPVAEVRAARDRQRDEILRRAERR
jgi:hypothetical protein